MSDKVQSAVEAALKGNVGIDDVELASPEPTSADAVEKAIRTRAQLAQILTRGRTNARLQAILDKLHSDRYGVFVRNTDADIGHYEEMGFRVETGLVGVRGEHGQGDGRIVVGDVVLMSTSQENIAVIREIEHDMLMDKLDLPRKEYLNQAASGAGVPGSDSTVKL